MNALPRDWRVVRLEEVADTALGKMLDRGRAGGHPTVRYLRNLNVQWGHVSTENLLEMELHPDERDRFQVLQGDLLVCEGGEIGRAAIWNGGAGYVGYQKALHRVRSRGNLDLRFLRYLLEHYAQDGTLARHATGSTIPHLPQQELRAIPVPLPPLEEQRRIVDILEDHLSRLDAADANVHGVQRRIRALELSFAAELLRQPWPRRRLAEVLEFSVGGVWGSEPGLGEVDVDVLRVTELKAAGRIDPRTAARRSVSRKQLATRALRPGDLLLEKSGGGPTSPVGRVGFVPDLDRAAICSNFMQLMRPDQKVVVPKFLHSFLNAFQLSGGTLPMQKASTNIRNLKASEYLQVRVPVPSIGDQIRWIEADSQRRESLDLLMKAVGGTRRRAASLRRALLDAAFSGRLTGAASDVDRVEERARV